MGVFNRSAPAAAESENISSDRPNPFSSPDASVPASMSASATGSTTGVAAPNGRYFHSRRVRKGEVEKPWLDKVDPKEKWVTIIPILGIIAGLGVSGFLVYDGLASVSHHNYCEVLIEDWSNGFNTDVWTKEVQLGGYGYGEFQETTSGTENVYIEDEILYIKPTLQNKTLVETNGATIDLRTTNSDGICTSSLYDDCVATTNTTNSTIVNPVKSGRINTKVGANIRFGRVEVEAKLPAGDWLWPSIFMMPTDAVYGTWPKSGEIDIVESRGNNYTYAQGGNNIISSTLHWGPTAGEDGYWRNNVKREALHTTYAAGFNTFGIEWSEKYLFSFVNSRLLQVLYVSFAEDFWSKGDYPSSTSNGTVLSDPWTDAEVKDAAPFDQNFFLTLQVAVGGTNGWFEDGDSDKPWADGADDAMYEFWNARSVWYPTWEKNGWMAVKSVKIYQQEGWNGC